MPWFCAAHWPFISPGVRQRIVGFTRIFRGGRDAAPPPAMVKLLKLALLDIRDTPYVKWNWADRAAMAVWRFVCGGG